jgi:hypothetical protein
VPSKLALKSQTIGVLQFEFCKSCVTFGKNFDRSLALMTARLSMKIIGNDAVVQ